MQSAPVAFERYPGAAARALPPSYRREPEKTALYQVVSRNLEACLELAETWESFAAKTKRSKRAFEHIRAACTARAAPGVAPLRRCLP